jgi:hypothetical protein
MNWGLEQDLELRGRLSVARKGRHSDKALILSSRIPHGG